MQPYRFDIIQWLVALLVLSSFPYHHPGMNVIVAACALAAPPTHLYETTRTGARTSSDPVVDDGVSGMIQSNNGLLI